MAASRPCAPSARLPALPSLSTTSRRPPAATFTACGSIPRPASISTATWPRHTSCAPGWCRPTPTPWPPDSPCNWLPMQPALSPCSSTTCWVASSAKPPSMASSMSLIPATSAPACTCFGRERKGPLRRCFGWWCSKCVGLPRNSGPVVGLPPAHNRQRQTLVDTCVS